MPNVLQLNAPQALHTRSRCLIFTLLPPEQGRPPVLRWACEDCSTLWEATDPTAVGAVILDHLASCRG